MICTNYYEFIRAKIKEKGMNNEEFLRKAGYSDRKIEKALLQFEHYKLNPCMIFNFNLIARMLETDIEVLKAEYKKDLDYHTEKKRKFEEHKADLESQGYDISCVSWFGWQARKDGRTYRIFQKQDGDMDLKEFIKREQSENKP